MLSLRPLLLSEISQTMTIRAYIVWTMYEVFGLNNSFSFANDVLLSHDGYRY